MIKIGILTYHYSNNFGGVLQSYALYKHLKSIGANVEILNFVPLNYNNRSILFETGIRKNIFKMKIEDIDPKLLANRILIKKRYSKEIIRKFDLFRDSMEMSEKVNEGNITSVINNYDVIIVGSDQVWSSGQRNKKEYFLGFDNRFKGKKISYAADSTISEVDPNQANKLKGYLEDFDFISVRNDHTHKFVKTLIGRSAPIVVDPTILFNFDNFEESNINTLIKDEKYILVYALGKEINGTNKKAIEKIKQIYGDIKVYSVVIPTMKFNLCNYADKVFYDIGPLEWIDLFKNASFIYTDSYHGVLFSLKYHKPFLAYYTEKLRATRFIDLGKRYSIDKYIVQNIREIDDNKLLDRLPDFNSIDKIIDLQKISSLEFLKKALSE